MTETLMALAAENGFSHWAAADMSALTPRQDVRDMCRADRCGRWNASWSCPPACGTLEQTAADIRRFDAGLVVQTTGALADEFDYAAMEDIQRRHKRSFESFARQVRLLTGECLPLSAGSCTLCRRCTYPDRPCRFPQRRMASMEAYGLLMLQPGTAHMTEDVCRRSGLGYYYGTDTMTYTSCVLYKTKNEVT